MKKKAIVTFGMIVLMLGMGMNVQYALADYGIEKNSLHVAVLSQSSGGGGDSSAEADHGHQERKDITCTIKISDGPTSSYEKTITGELYWCKGDNYVETCVNYNPCAGFYNPY